MGRRVSAFFSTIVLLAASACASGAGPLVRNVDDTSASLAVKSRMLRSDSDFSGVDVDVVDGLVLLTGRVPDAEARIEAERIAWSAPRVRDVANELTIGGSARSALGVGDQWISGQVRARLLSDTQVRSTQINVETHGAVVYLMGRARNEGEARRAASHASLIPGVARVISFLRIDGEAEIGRQQSPPEQPLTPELAEEPAPIEWTPEYEDEIGGSY